MLVPFHCADKIGDRFLALLSKHGVQPPVYSSIEGELLSLTQLIEVTKNPALAQGPAAVSILRAAAGIHDLAAKVLAFETNSEFATFIPHLQLIAKSGIRATSIGQNVISGPYDDTSRKMAELYLGCLVSLVGTQIELDSPTAATGDNPDILFTAEPAGGVARRWALAVKTISSKHGQTIFERIKEGGQQIDSPKCAANSGMIVINAKNAIDHTALWQTPYANIVSAKCALSNQLVQLANSANANRSQAEWDAVFAKRVVRPVLFLGQSLVRVPTPAGAETPTALKVLLSYGANGQLDQIGASIATYINDAMQSIVLGIPGQKGVLPM